MKIENLSPQNRTHKEFEKVPLDKIKDFDIHYCTYNKNFYGNLTLFLDGFQIKGKTQYWATPELALKELKELLVKAYLKHC